MFIGGSPPINDKKVGEISPILILFILNLIAPFTCNIAYDLVGISSFYPKAFYGEDQVHP